jgi:hypothetical protein
VSFVPLCVGLLGRERASTTSHVPTAVGRVRSPDRGSATTTLFNSDVPMACIRSHAAVLDLAERLASRGHRVTFVSTPRNIARFPSVRTQAGAVDRVSYSAWWRFRCHTSTACRMLPSPPTMSLTTRWSSSGRPLTGSQRPSRSSSAPPLTRAAGDRTDASSSISSTTGPPPLPASTRFHGSQIAHGRPIY